MRDISKSEVDGQYRLHVQFSAVDLGFVDRRDFEEGHLYDYSVWQTVLVTDSAKYVRYAKDKHVYIGEWHEGSK